MTKTDHVADAIAQALEAKGCPHLFDEIELMPQAIVRPPRALDPHEAMAMAAAWSSGYKAMGVPICPHARCDYCDCPSGAFPDLSDEETLHQTMEDLMREAGPYLNRWPR